MKFLWEKRNYLLGIIIVLLLFWIFKNDNYTRSFNFNDKKITYVFYENINKHDVYNKIKEIYQKRVWKISGKDKTDVVADV